MGHVNTHQLSVNELQNLKDARWKSRTDLGWLCREVLGYTLVDDTIHGPIIKLLQQFPLFNRNIRNNADRLNRNGNWDYSPRMAMYDLPGRRRRLILDPRSWFKTTLNAQAHSIQWILNYPDITMQIIQSNTEKAEMILGEIKRHFQSNSVFRELFPDYCPQKKPHDWGTKSQFITEARRMGRRESTVMIGAIDKGAAGLHFDVMKFSDIVEPTNVKTDEQIASVKRTYYMMENLLVRPDSWIDIEGTRYAFGDLYGDILDRQLEIPPDERMWDIHIRGCYQKIDPETKKTQTIFTPETIRWPLEKDEDGSFISWWPKVWPAKSLEEKRAVDPYIFATQQLNDPTGDEQEQIFPVNDNYPKRIKRQDFEDNIRVAYRQATVDTAETQNERSNYSVITVAAVGEDGRKYVEDIRRGKFKADELIELMFVLFLRYKLRYLDIEETSYVRGLRAYLERLQSIRNIWLPLRFLKRDNRTSKEERIRNTLQPYYKSGTIRFLDDLVEMPALLKELQQFPLGVSNDILDTIADLFANQEWFGREHARPSPKQRHADMMEDWVFGKGRYADVPSLHGDYHARTGGL